MKVVIVGGGASGFSAKVAKNCGVEEVTLIERTDTLGGWALVSGIGLCGSGSFTILEEVLGGATFFNEIVLPIATHSELMMPGFDRAMLNVTKLDGRMKNLFDSEINLILEDKVTKTKTNKNKIERIS